MMVKKGRAKEIDKLKTRGVHEVVSRDQAKLGKMMRTRWVETLKGDEVRCRFVAQEFAKGDPRDDLFASSKALGQLGSYFAETDVDPHDDGCQLRISIRGCSARSVHRVACWRS